MDCAAFERELIDWLSGDVPQARRQKRLQRLEQHVATCGACAGARDLLDWARLGSAQRDLADDPGPDYWSSFNARLHARIAATEGDVGPAQRQRGARRAAVAALLVAALLGLGSLAVWRLRPGPGTSPIASAPGGEDVATAGTEDQPLEVPDEIARLWVADAPDALVDAGAGAIDDDEWVDDEEGGWAFPDTDQLDPRARRALLDWLRERTAEMGGRSS